MRALHAAILELEPIQFLLMLSPCIVRLVRDYGPEPAKEMFLTTIDNVVALKGDVAP